MGRRRARDESASLEDIEYDERLDDATRALENLDRPGECFTSGVFTSFPHPGLEVKSQSPDAGDGVESMETIPLPLTADNATRLIAKCHLAPYGHGEKTLIDTNVRNTWELNARELALTNPQWHAFITQEILQSVRVRLGISEAAQVEAKLYKLLLYEEGGKFERHQDSEKEPGMFGTLVVVLPGEFKGGELLVHQPAATANQKQQQQPHVWNPATTSGYDLKYAAFYGDCAHEVKPVTSGYRLCLTYNLVTTTVAEIPRFAGSSKLQEAITMSLCHFFTESLPAKRPKYGYSSWNSNQDTVPHHRHFTYLLEHDYSDQGLRFEFLKNKDRLVASSLAQFCDDTKGEFVLYLAKLRYSHVSDPDVDDVEPEITVTLQSPWVRHGTSQPLRCPDVEVDHVFEVAPAGCLENVEFDDCETEYTGNEGTREEQWYESAALVIQPLSKEFDQLVDAPFAAATATFVRLVESNSPRAAEFGSLFLMRTHAWTSSSPAFVQCLQACQQLHDVVLFLTLVKSATNFEFQPLLAPAVALFGFDTCIQTLTVIARHLKPRSRINLVCSILDGSTDAIRIASLLDELDMAPPIRPPAAPRQYAWQKPPHDAFAHPTPQEYSRVLQLASQISIAKTAGYLVTSDDRTLVTLVAPAFELFAQSLPSGAEAVAPLLQSLYGQLQARLPALRNTPFRETKVDHTCDKCVELQSFLSADSSERMQLSIKNKTQLKHLESVLKRINRQVSFRTVSLAPIVVELLKQFGENELHKSAQLLLQSLSKMLSASSTSNGNALIPPLQLRQQQHPPQSGESSSLTPRSLPPLTSLIRPPQSSVVDLSQPTRAPPASDPEIIVISDSE